jgi:hypothetical protein
LKALYLYFADTATPGRGPSSTPDDVRPVYDEPMIPMIPIQPGAYSRWKANRDRVIAENAAALRGTSLGVRTERSARPG